jgi:hypothetical protein
MVLVLVLLAVALVVALVLWIAIGRRDDDDAAATSTTVATGAAPTVAPASTATITGVTTYDPPPGDGEENDDQAMAALADRDPATNWKSLCYLRTTMSKDGVGLVVTLSAAAMGTLSFDVGNPPFKVEVFGSDAESPPADFAGWGTPFKNVTASDTAQTIRVQTPVPARHLLIVLREIGRDRGCSGANPNRGSIGEISFG